MSHSSPRTVLPSALLVLVGLVGMALPPYSLDAAHALAAVALVAGLAGLLLGRRDERGDVAGDTALAGTTRAHVPAATDPTTGLFEESPTGIVLTDADGVVVRSNAALAGTFGRRATELAGTRLSDFSASGADALDAHLRGVLAGVDGTTGNRAEWLGQAADGSTLHLTLTSVVVDDDQSATPRRLVLSHVVDATERFRHAETLAHLTVHDKLTGLANRHGFETVANRHLEACQADGARGALMLLDLDHFKEVNDTLGHGVGDALITEIAELLGEGLHGDDLVARLGGDEFAILLPNADAPAARFVAQDILERVRLFAQTQEGVLRRVTASIGVVLIGDKHTSLEDLLSTADMTMYDAKEAGRDQYIVLGQREHEQPRTGARMAWSERIHHAIEHDEFVLELQPILDVRTGRINSAEALIRLQDGDELVMPERFLYIAERTGEIIDIDRWVIDKSIEILARIQQTYPGFQLEVNLSGKSIGSPLLDAALTQSLLRYGADPTGLVLEITETAAVAHMQTALSFAERQRRLGCKFALDDFGAGYGSFYYLKHLPIDYVKIDGEFVAGCATNDTDRRIVGSIVGIARGLGKQTIAEHVSSPEILAVIKEEGVDYAQGFDVSASVSYDSLMEMLSFQQDDVVYVGKRRA
jgi:diguanylate cyclase (GGDEF)-like protein/PAS domain S-box-containing protein